MFPRSYWLAIPANVLAYPQFRETPNLKFIKGKAIEENDLMSIPSLHKHARANK